MDLIVYRLLVEDRDTDKIYETGYKFDHSRVAEEIHSEVDDLGGVEKALDEGIQQNIARVIDTNEVKN